MSHHLFRCQNLINQHQATNYLANRIFLRRVNNSSVVRNSCCKTKKVIILREDDSFCFPSHSKNFLIRRSKISGFGNSQYIHTSST